MVLASEVAAEPAAGFAPANTRLVFLAAAKKAYAASHLTMAGALAPVGDGPLLHRTMRQFHELGFRDQFVVSGCRAMELGASARACFPETDLLYSPDFVRDAGLSSVLAALRRLAPGQGVLVVEADALVMDAAALAIARCAGKGESTWVAHGSFVPERPGVALQAGTDGWVCAIRDACEGGSAWRAGLGIVYVAPRHVPVFRDILAEFVARRAEVGYAQAWGDNLDVLPAYMLDVGAAGGAVCGSPERYAEAVRLIGATGASAPDVTLLDVAGLKHIEEFDPARAAWLERKICIEGVWTAPLAVSREHGLVMDGQHRLEAALRLGLKRVPALLYDYAAISVYSLRPGHRVTVEEIIARALARNPYPYKTAKHVLPLSPGCRIPLSELF